MTRARTCAPHRRRWLHLAAAGIIVAAGAVACGDDNKKTTATASAETQALHQAFLNVIEKWNAKDLDGFIALFTEKGFVSSFGGEGQTLEEVRARFQQFFGSEDLGDPQFSRESVTGDAGTMDVVFRRGPVYLHSKFTLAKTGAAWKLNGEEKGRVDIPAGATTVNVDLSEFAFGVDTSAITEATGKFALVAKNVGKQFHELGLAHIPDDAVIADLLQQLKASSSPTVPGVSFIALTDADPGQSNNLVFARPLEPGRYFMICFEPDTTEGPDGTPHALKGMVKEFTVK